MASYLTKTVAKRSALRQLRLERFVIIILLSNHCLIDGSKPLVRRQSSVRFLISLYIPPIPIDTEQRGLLYGSRVARLKLH